ncbi:beta-N-acteylhexosaminidase (GH3) [Formosa agariphila KMM 3901]|uniref:beta-N-acetylhexosaminidase n=1 Tax=Formosa agariphila (strain DSM 15362 / KCTC 12365 / LMG 23005 / KMM 3901 / M-2Alg 35-1) TaxID=1347342 RepID=T2KLR5_FORAG|nr:glycoside hydrolase family 3 N-terminal domain-containing protein [Formosa agariphila]CDF79690.1 beta-N-acteylhexosaminidase (GH3) [Formosa agariphila KMM 3901]
MNKILAIGILALLSLGFLPHDYKIETNNSKKKWVDSIYNSMSLKEKVGQLFMVAAYSNRPKSHVDSIQNLIKTNGIGGLIFFQGGPVRQAKLTNMYQSLSKVPLLIGMDAEWGLNMRLDSTSGFPYNMTLGAIQGDAIIEQIGKQIGINSKRLGVHLNFAPVVDINTNANNPIIGVRSFGEDKFNVTSKALAFTKGMQSEGVLACAKHFPGHGDTAKDSHKTLPTVSFSKEQINNVEFYPYKELFKKEVAGVMVAHLNVPSLESKEGLPSSLSYNIVTNILKGQLSYKGLVFTDALNMKGVANYKEPGDVDLAAFKAGNDVLLFTNNSTKGIFKIVEAYNNKEITEARLAHSVKKILAAKYNANLNLFKPIKIEGLVDDLTPDSNVLLNEEALTNSITIIKNEKQVLPIQTNNNEKIAFLKLGDGNSDSFFNAIKFHVNIFDVSNINPSQLLKELKKYDKVIISYHRLNYRDVKKIDSEKALLIEEIANNNQVILSVFASQYSLKEIHFQNIEGVIVSYENTDVAQRISALIVLGEKEALGKLPASINSELK